MREPKYPVRVKAQGVLTPYEDTLARWLKADQHRNKRERRGIKAMFEALRAMGYGGSRGPVYRFAKWKESTATQLWVTRWNSKSTSQGLVSRSCSLNSYRSSRTHWAYLLHGPLT